MEMKRPIVVILGMHRSGTSLTANFMDAIGIDVGQDLMPADESNAAGYWESTTIFDIHHKILAAMNCTWQNPPPHLPAGWRSNSDIGQLKSGLLEFVRSECERTDKIWGFKDPRTAVLLPLWQDIFDELQLEPHYILAVRHPGSVAASLSRRDGLSSSSSQALWLRTNLDSLSHTGNHLRAIVDYDRWFDSGFEQAHTVIDALNLSGSISEAQIAEALDRVILPGLRHHSSEKQVECSPIVMRFYSLLCRAAADGKIPDEIREVTETFENARDILDIWDHRVTERDEIIANDKRLLKKQRKRQQYSNAIIIVFVVLFMIYTFVLFGAYNWFK